MPLQFSTALRNNMLEQIETTAGTSARIQIYSGSVPANCAATATGTLLVEFSLGADWSPTAANGSKSLGSLPLVATATGNGVAGYFRLVNAAGTTCHMQGTVGQGAGDLSLDNTNIASGQTIQITVWTVNAPGA